MTRNLFTVGPHVYELTPELKSHFTDYLATDDAINAWFEGTVLWLAYEETDCNNPCCTLEAVDVVEVFETLQDDALETLDEAGAQPIVSAPDSITATGNAVVKMKDCA